MSLLQDREQQRFDLDHQIEDSLYARNLELPALYEKFDNGQLIHDVALIGAAANNPRIIIERHDPREVAGKPLPQVFVSVLREAMSAGPGDPMYDVIRQAFPQDKTYATFIARFRRYIPAYTKLVGSDPECFSLEDNAREEFRETHKGIADASKLFFKEFVDQYSDRPSAVTALQDVFAKKVGSEVSYYFLSGIEWSEELLRAQEELPRDDVEIYQTLGFLATMERLSIDFRERSLGSMATNLVLRG